MSADRQSDEPASAPNVASPDRSPRPTSQSDEPHLEAVRVSGIGDASDRRRSVPLAARIERTRLELQVAALEDALETSERRRQAVIDRYERLLTDRTASDEPSTSDGRLDSLLARFCES